MIYVHVILMCILMELSSLFSLSLSLYVGSLVKSPAASESTQVREIISFLKGHLDLVKGIVHYIRTATAIM